MRVIFFVGIILLSLSGCATKSLTVDKAVNFSAIHSIQVKKLEIDKYDVGGRLETLFRSLAVDATGDSDYFVVYDYRYAWDAVHFSLVDLKVYIKDKKRNAVLFAYEMDHSFGGGPGTFSSVETLLDNNFVELKKDLLNAGIGKL